MFKLILYKELREIIGSKKFAVTFGICSILIILAFYSGIENYKTGVQEYNASAAAALMRYEKYTEWNRVTSHQVFLKPEPLAYLVMGVSNDLGRTAGINGRNTPTAGKSIYSQQPVFAVFRFLDLEFVFRIVLSLFAVLFAYDAVNGEKERGTLRLSFANPVPRAGYILGKLAGTFLALALPLLVPILTGVLLLPLMGVSLSPDEWTRLGMFITTGLLYLGVFLTLSVSVSCFTQHSSSAFLFLLVIWVFSVLIIPRASVLLAGSMVDVPTIEEINYKRVLLMKQNTAELINRLSEFSRKTYEEPMKSGVFDPAARDRARDSVSSFLDKIGQENNKRLEDLTDRLNEDRHNKQDQQKRLAFGIARISPTASFNLASTSLCGTSLDLKDHFIKQATDYSRSFGAFIRSKTGYEVGSLAHIYNDAAARTAGIKKAPSEPINTGEIPEFRFKSKALPEILGNTLPDLAILILFNIIFFSAAFLSFLRYDLR